MDGWFIFTIVITLIAISFTVAYRIFKSKFSVAVAVREADEAKRKEDEAEDRRKEAEASSSRSGGGYRSSYQSDYPSTQDQNKEQRQKTARRETDLGTITRLLKRVMISLWITVTVLTLWSSVHQVATKNVGAVTSYGKPVGNLDNGLGMTWPWEVVTELDAALQTDSYAGDDETPC